MQIGLCDTNPKMIEAWNKEFIDVPLTDCITYDMDFRLLPEVIDKNNKIILCTTGNSYGVMGGGLDLQIAKHFLGIEEYIRYLIKENFQGEIAVGNCIFAPLTQDQMPFAIIAYCPTMRAPVRLASAENVYLATKAALQTFLLLQSHPEIFDDAIMIMPGFGGGCGRLEPRRIAKAMRLAYDNVIRFDGEMPTTTIEMLDRHANILSI